MELSSSSESGQYLTFRVADEEYAIGILQVKEIIQYETVTRVPTTPPWIRGVINLRGSVVPVVDLAAKLGLAETVVTSLTCIVIVEVAFSGERTVMGVMADSVSQVVDLGAGDVEAPPSFGTRVHVDYLAGMGKVGKGFVLILDIDRVLSADELLAAAAAVDAAEAEAGRSPGDAPPARKRRSPKAKLDKPEPEPAGGAREPS
jgi:purine-binding chemotaxis protein CheW